ncbi:uncharacterized protein DUF397 [Micromonospora kangleipakensis]|uniref:Uncharacterized protein DUF397 n=1 Tax=Micromonospora kangleipakensis TaxID=1077942 RepID=A0A4Q8BCD3_9ACTN|nr:DUF397 domain-containing protein [Micromonospora kangleipakensis]RZU75514.1 uncharacterized protein DUF397 [Micromonospora kangleipakensis]
MTDLTGAVWRKTSRSGGNGGNCVEVADNLPGIVAVRDSKHSAGPALAFPAEVWGSFVSAIKAERFHPDEARS